MSNGLIAGIIASFQITIFFIVVLIIYSALGSSPIGENSQAKAVLDTGQQATINAFNLWSLADEIAGLIVFLGVIFGLIYAVIKIVEKESGGTAYY